MRLIAISHVFYCDVSGCFRSYCLNKTILNILYENKVELRD